MHYIRFLKPPRLGSTPSSSVLSAKITVTTDLGEAFLFTDITLVVDLESQTGAKILGPGNGREYIWKGSDGARSLEVSIPIPASKRKEIMRMVIRPKESKYDVDNFGLMLPGATISNDDEGRVMAIRSMDIDASQPAGQKGGVGMAKRVLSLGGKVVPICEETGESIARHIWYDWTGTSAFSSVTNGILQGCRAHALLVPCYHLTSQHLTRTISLSTKTPSVETETRSQEFKRLRAWSRMRHRRHHPLNILPQHLSNPPHRPPRSLRDPNSQPLPYPTIPSPSHHHPRSP